MARGVDPHIGEEELEKYCMKKASEQEEARIDGHLLQCEACQKRVLEMDEYVASMRTAARQLRGQPEAPRHVRHVPSTRPSVIALAAVVVVGAIVIQIAWRRSTPAFTVEMQATRGVAVGATAPSGRPLILLLDISTLEPMPAYRVEVVDNTGAAVWSGEGTAKDSKVAVPVPRMHPGAHFVRMYAGGQLLREFGLEVH